MRLAITLLLIILPLYGSEEPQSETKKGTFLSRSAQDASLITRALLHSLIADKSADPIPRSTSLPLLPDNNTTNRTPLRSFLEELDIKRSRKRDPRGECSLS